MSKQHVEQPRAHQQHVKATCRTATSYEYWWTFDMSTKPSTPASSTATCCSFVRHVERNWTCLISFDMSKGWKNRSTCCQNRQHVEQKHSTCRSNVRHVASTCCWCGRGFRLIGKHVVDFLLVLIELFFLGATAKALRANIDWKSAISIQRGPVDSKFQVEGVALHQPFFSEIKLSDLSYGIKFWADLSFVLSQWQTDWQTDGEAAFSWLDRRQRGKNHVKKEGPATLSVLSLSLSELGPDLWHSIVSGVGEM